MKRHISILLLLIMILQINVFAADSVFVTKNVTYTKDFTNQVSSYDTSTDGWNITATVTEGSGLTTGGNVLMFNEVLGDKYTVSGQFYFQGGRDRLYLGERLYIELIDYYDNAISCKGRLRYTNGSSDETIIDLSNLHQYWNDKMVDFKIVVEDGDKVTMTINRNNNTGDVTQTIDSVKELLVAKDITDDTPLGKFGVAVPNSNFFKKVSLSYAKSIEVKPLGIMPEFQSFGVNTTDGLKLHFTAPVDEAMLTSSGILTSEGFTIDGITMSNDDKTATLMITPSSDDCTLTISGTLLGKDGEWMGETQTSQTPFVYNFKVNSSTDDLTKVKENSILLSPDADENALYDGKRFDNEVYYTGDITLAGESYVYFGTKKNDDGLEGYRVKIISGESSKVEIESFTDIHNPTTVAEATLTNKFEDGDKVKFGIEINNNGTSVNVFVVGNGAMANVRADNVELPGGYVGVGCDSAKSTFDSLKVFATALNEYSALEALEKSAVFETYSVYKSSDSIEIRIKVNVNSSALVGTPVYIVDDGEPQNFENIVGDAESTTYSASVTGLTQGNHGIVAKFLDKFGDIHEFTSKGIVISDENKIIPLGFYDSDTEVLSLSDMRGKTLTVKFDADIARGYNIFIVLRNGTAGKVDMKYQNVPAGTTAGIQSVTLDIPDIDVTNHTVKAFICDALNSIPVSGYIELK